MDELVKTFHIDWKLIIAQTVNFTIVLGVLWYFAFKPLMKVILYKVRCYECFLCSPYSLPQWIPISVHPS